MTSNAGNQVAMGHIERIGDQEGGIFIESNVRLHQLVFALNRKTMR